MEWYLSTRSLLIMLVFSVTQYGARTLTYADLRYQSRDRVQCGPHNGLCIARSYVPGQIIPFGQQRGNQYDQRNVLLLELLLRKQGLLNMQNRFVTGDVGVKGMDFRYNPIVDRNALLVQLLRRQYPRYRLFFDSLIRGFTGKQNGAVTDSVGVKTIDSNYNQVIDRNALIQRLLLGQQNTMNSQNRIGLGIADVNSNWQKGVGIGSISANSNLQNSNWQKGVGIGGVGVNTADGRQVVGQRVVGRGNQGWMTGSGWQELLTRLNIPGGQQVVRPTGPAFTSGYQGGIALSGGRTGGSIVVGGRSGGVSVSGGSYGGSIVSGGESGGLSMSGGEYGGSVSTGDALGGVSMSGGALGGSLSSGGKLGGLSLAGGAQGGSLVTGSESGGISMSGGASGGSLASGGKLGGLSLAGGAQGGSLVTGSASGGISMSGGASGGSLASGGNLGGLSLAGGARGGSLVTGSESGRISMSGSASGGPVSTGRALGGVSMSGGASGGSIVGGRVPGEVTTATDRYGNSMAGNGVAGGSASVNGINQFGGQTFVPFVFGQGGGEIGQKTMFGGTDLDCGGSGGVPDMIWNAGGSIVKSGTTGGTVGGTVSTNSGRIQGQSNTIGHKTGYLNQARGSLQKNTVRTSTDRRVGGGVRGVNAVLGGVRAGAGGGSSVSWSYSGRSQSAAAKQSSQSSNQQSSFSFGTGMNQQQVRGIQDGRFGYGSSLPTNSGRNQAYMNKQNQFQPSGAVYSGRQLIPYNF